MQLNDGRRDKNGQYDLPLCHIVNIYSVWLKNWYPLGRVESSSKNETLSQGGWLCKHREK